ncbi:hypothetical protein [Microbispora rosea]|nr:hypothetical protein [Microbispora rosea]
MAARMAAEQQGPTAPTQGERREVPSTRAALVAEMGDLIEVAHA